ncbi:MAG: DUF4386 family protein [Chloroflexi bacterium]|nr:DUF4386 family protein [Chloroflexota bacterium]
MKNTPLQKWGGAAAIYEALAYIMGMVGFIMVVNISEITDPLQKVAAIAANQGLLSLLQLGVYILWGGMLVVLSLALHERLRGESSALVRTATAFGLIWAGLVMASGMIYSVGMEKVVTLNANDPALAATVWLTIESVANAIGGDVEIVGGVWVLLLSAAALRNGGLPRAFSFFGLLVGAAGAITLVPALAEAGAMAFGVTQIIWFAWLGIALLSSRPQPQAGKAKVYVAPTA